MQKTQTDWHWQWKHLKDDSKFLFSEWIWPYRIEDFINKVVVDAGCGGGQHTNFVAPVAKKIYAVDLNTTGLAKERNCQFGNIVYIQGDLANTEIPEKADILFCIGVIQHTDNPDATFQNLLKQIKPGGSLLLWCYAKEGNFLNEYLLEPIKKYFLLKMPKNALLGLAYFLTFALYPIVYTIYLLPLHFLPYFEYFKNWRKLTYKRNMLNVFDKLNAPQTYFLEKSTIEKWFSPEIFSNIHIDHYAGVSWRASGTLK